MFGIWNQVLFEMKGGWVCIPSCHSFIGSQLSWFCRRKKEWAGISTGWTMQRRASNVCFWFLQSELRSSKRWLMWLIASSSVVAIHYPLPLSISCVRSLNQILNTYRLLAYSNHNISTAISDDHFSFVRFRCFSFHICFEKWSKVLNFLFDDIMVALKDVKNCIQNFVFKFGIEN